MKSFPLNSTLFYCSIFLKEVDSSLILTALYLSSMCHIMFDTSLCLDFSMYLVAVFQVFDLYVTSVKFVRIYDDVYLLTDLSHMDQKPLAQDLYEVFLD